MSQVLSLIVSGVVLVLLLGPPVVALRMLLRRLKGVPPDRRMSYQALVALTGLVLAFNLLVWAGMPAALRGFLPDLVARNLGLSALLASWGAVGLCLLVAVLHPHRQRSRA
jgi:polyferredoxin